MSTEDDRPQNDAPNADSTSSAQVTTLTLAQKQEYTLGMLCHLLSFALYLGIPVGNIIGPLVLWLLKKDESEFVDATGKEVLNFQISLTIYGIICIPLIFLGVGLILVPVLMILAIVYTIIGAIKANEGEVYQYPCTIRFIK